MMMGGGITSEEAEAAGGFFGNIANFLGNSSVNQALRTGGEYYLGQENIQDVRRFGREMQEGAGILAEQARAGAEFKPYTVTSGLANIATDPTGGFAIDLSPEQQALQAQLQGQAAGLFGQVGQDPAAQQAAIFEQIRATQRPEEERQRLALEERMLSQGRLGLSSAAYGGASPELLAQETARQEAMARANVGARTASTSRAAAGSSRCYRTTRVLVISHREKLLIFLLLVKYLLALLTLAAEKVLS